MPRYLFSIFTRGFLAVTGILFFVVSARLFGAEGRGVIGYGTSLFAVSGLLMSFNLGRTFLLLTQKKEDNKRDLLATYLYLNLVLIIASSVLGIVFWFFSRSAQNILSLKQVLIFSVSSAYYVWTSNGNPFFSSVSRIYVQDKIIFSIRLVMLIFLFTFSFYKVESFDIFIMMYGFILSTGSIIEISYLYSIHKKFNFDRSKVKEIFKKSITPHFDYLAFNSFPLVLIVISGVFLEKALIGRASFVIQMINLVFMFGLVANNKLNSYVSEIGLRERKKEIFKLLYFTLALTILASGFLYLVITSDWFRQYFTDFDGLGGMFLLSALAVPGYVSYQFCNPFWIEKNLLDKSAKYTFVAYIFCLALSPYLLSRYGEFGMTAVFALFHMFLLLAQWVVYRRYLKK